MVKTFNIGECCLYGTIIAERKDTKLTIKVCDYKTKNVRVKETFDFVDKAKLQWFLEDYTTPYYADKVVKHFYI